ncbi:MAG TPA: gephyrin-like molybdotransferase Glp [Thermodesulfobacteriota bacterium]|nr:gephyrin-like molybdotransferase Glp [Thermodesulfobacteriota bacterium]
MISFDEALNNILSHIAPLGFEKVPLLQSLGRVIGEDAFAKWDIPPFDNSAMDGYALRFEDVEKASPDHPARLEVIEDLPAGSLSKKTIGRGQAIRIMTGAPIPKGADAVIPVEDTKKGDGFVSIFKNALLGENIRKAGEDVRKGDRIISRGDIIRPAEVGMLASVGRSSVSVYQKPLVAILCTGDELVDVDENLEEGKIISSNSYTLAAQVEDCGAVPVQLGIAKDRKEEIEKKLRQGIRADVLISSAGVSVGDYDFVKDVLGDLGMKMAFWQVAMKPGKPLAFGTIQGKPVFGLPGNPVSSMVSFEQFVRPSLLKMMGHRQIFRPVVEVFLQDEIEKKPGRRHFIRAFVSFKEGSYFATTTGDQGSGILRSMVKANGLIIIPEDQEIARAGEKVKVQLLDRNF